jgi:hypothetical protein
MNSTILNNTTYNGNLLIRVIPEGCNQTTDKIIENISNNISEITCYHQVSAEEKIKPIAPALYIFTGIISLSIGYLIFKYLKNRHGKQ